MSIKNELKSWEYLRKYCELKLSLFSSTLEQDEKELASGNLSFVDSNICRVKILDKKIYHFWIETANVYTKFCSMTRKEA
jgi:hypothetical protein